MKLKLMVAFVIGLLVSSVSVYAASILSKDIGFNPSDSSWDVNNVEDALNYLYSSSKNYELSEAGKINSPGASFKFEKDGIITGTLQTTGSYSALIYFDGYDNENIRAISSATSNNLFYQSIYVSKGTTVYTRKSYGAYDLTVYYFN